MKYLSSYGFLPPGKKVLAAFILELRSSTLFSLKFAQARLAVPKVPSLCCWPVTPCWMLGLLEKGTLSHLFFVLCIICLCKCLLAVLSSLDGITTIKMLPAGNCFSLTLVIYFKSTSFAVFIRVQQRNQQYQSEPTKLRLHTQLYIFCCQGLLLSSWWAHKFHIFLHCEVWLTFLVEYCLKEHNPDHRNRNHDYSAHTHCRQALWLRFSCCTGTRGCSPYSGHVGLWYELMGKWETRWAWAQMLRSLTVYLLSLPGCWVLGKALEVLAFLLTGHLTKAAVWLQLVYSSSCKTEEIIHDLDYLGLWFLSSWLSSSVSYCQALRSTQM